MSDSIHTQNEEIINGSDRKANHVHEKRQVQNLGNFFSSARNIWNFIAC